jgi:electron transport complex protein RnfC
LNTINNADNILELPLPPLLAVPLPTNRPRLEIEIGDVVCAGQTIAVSDAGADVLSPVTGIVGVPVIRRLASPIHETALCLPLTTENVRKLPPAVVVLSPDIQVTLKKAGVVGLGGGAFPAWRKYRPQIKQLIINAVESDTHICCDRALLAVHRQTLAVTVARIAYALSVPAAIIALRHDAPDISPVEGVNICRIPTGYALGNERLLVRHLLDTVIPSHETLADHGIMCFNIGTALAIDDALTNSKPMLGRVLTVRRPDGDVINLRVPFGVSIRDVATFANVRTAMAHIGGRDARAAMPADAVIHAKTNIINFCQTAQDTPLPCIRCGDCLPVCPENLSPLHLYADWRDGDFARMEKRQLDACLLCRRCDDVCPSNISLTNAFATAQHHVAVAREKNVQTKQWQTRYERHQQRLDVPRQFAGVNAAARAAQAMNRVAKAKRATATTHK